MAATEWIASGAAAGRSAIVVCSDIARYGLNTAGEPTQGGGAVALLVSEQPDLLAVDIGLNGVCSMDVYDFWRPLGRRGLVEVLRYGCQRGDEAGRLAMTRLMARLLSTSHARRQRHDADQI